MIGLKNPINHKYIPFCEDESDVTPSLTRLGRVDEAVEDATEFNDS